MAVAAAADRSVSNGLSAIRLKPTPSRTVTTCSSVKTVRSCSTAYSPTEPQPYDTNPTGLARHSS